MCIIFGAPSIILACVALLQIPDKPETAKFLNENERQIETERIKLGKYK